MLNTDDVPRGLPPQPGRRPPPTRSQDSRFNSPSSSYNFNSSSGYNQGNGLGGQQHPRRRIDRFKRESINYNDRMIRQNDSIIRLLKEIRDRLPAPPASTRVIDEQDQNVEETAANSSASEINETVAEGMDQGFNQNSETDQPADGEVESQPE